MLGKVLEEKPVAKATGIDRLYTALAETSRDAVLLVSPDGKIRSGNAHAASMFGFYHAREMEHVKFSGLVAAEEYEALKLNLKRAVKYGSSKKVEHCLRSVEGRLIPAELNISAVKNDYDEVEAFIILVCDISERKQLETKMHRLAEELRIANQELEHAYETTLEGWTGVLDLRDKETEGHSRRVTEVTVALALMMGIAEKDLPNIRRGALLHDIGKIGIPDDILLKPSTLTEEEWQVMRMHPVYAHQLLSQISFLQEASVIPHCHHERWDGTGYPQGLKGEEIPLAARLFAVVDVWEALRSNRPYRRAWPEEKVRDYLRAQSGTHFDPQVVEVFLKMDTSIYRRQATMPLEAMLEIIERAHNRDTVARLTGTLLSNDKATGQL